MTIHIIGARGLIGHALYCLSQTLGHHTYGYASPQFTLATPHPQMSVLAIKPGDTIVNCAGYTNVDASETEPELCYLLNAYSPAQLAHYAYEHNCRFISLSTDYVFSHPIGYVQHNHYQPWKPNDPTHTQCTYGAAKLLGERLIFRAHPDAVIIRTSWVYSSYLPPIAHPNFVTSLAHKALTQQLAHVVDDQIGSPTFVDDIAHALLSVALSTISGTILHYAGQGQCSWYELAQKIYLHFNVNPELVQPISSATLARAATRPVYSPLCLASWNNYHLAPTYPWDHALKRALDVP